MDDLEKFMAEVRLLSAATGKLYECQITALQLAPLSLLGPDLKVDLSIDFDSKSVVYQLHGKIEVSDEIRPLRLTALDAAVRQIVGDFKVTVVTGNFLVGDAEVTAINNNLIHGTANGSTRTKPTSKTKPNRKKRVRKVPSKRKTAAKPKNRR